VNDGSLSQTSAIRSPEFDQQMTRKLANPLLKLLGVLVASFIVVPVSAEDESAEIDTLVVMATRLKSGLFEIPQTIEIITAGDIAARQAPNVTELLRQAAGLNVIQQGARGGVTSVVLRGGESNFSVVLIDGVKVNDSTNTRGGSYDFSYLDLASIERVEIVRGPMSAIYGSDALAGVINIITRPPDNGAELRAEVGGHGLQSGRVAVGGDRGNLQGMIGVRALREDGDIEGASYEDWGLDGSIRFDFGESGEAGLLFRHQDAESTSFPEDSGGPVFAVIREVDERAVRETHGRLFLSRSIGNNWQSDFSISRYDRNEQADSPGIAPGVFDGVPPNSADTDFVRSQLSAAFSSDLTENTAIVFGGEWQREEGESIGVLDIGFPLPTDFRLDRDTLSAFTEIDFRVNRLLLQGSLRWDDPGGIDGESSSQIGASFTLPGDAGGLRLNWGDAFKAPSFFALGHPLVGNPDLESETATSVDFGYRRIVGSSASIDISIYRNEFENLIDFDPALFTNVNRSKVVTEGVELSARFAIGSSVEVDLHLTYAEAEIKDSDAILRGRPKWRGGITANWQINDQWLFAGSLLSLDEFYEVSIPTGGLFLDGYERLDLALSFAASDKLHIGFAVDNVLDAEYFEAVGFPAAGIRGRVNATYQF
jgi:outer membrane cobalamin receptor